MLLKRLTFMVMLGFVMVLFSGAEVVRKRYAPHCPITESRVLRSLTGELVPEERGRKDTKPA